MEKNIRKSNLPAIGFALAALAATLPSSAFAGNGAPTEKVPYGDLNLATQAGVETLDRRLDRAVQRVCGSASMRDLPAQARIEQCREDTWKAIEDDRQVAIAKATGQDNVQQAARGTRTPTQVSLAE